MMISTSVDTAPPPPRLDESSVYEVRASADVKVGETQASSLAHTVPPLKWGAPPPTQRSVSQETAAYTPSRHANLGAPRPLDADLLRAKKQRHLELAILKARGELSRRQRRELAMLRFEFEQQSKALGEADELAPLEEIAARYADLSRQLGDLTALLQSRGARPRNAQPRSRARKRQG